MDPDRELGRVVVGDARLPVRSAVADHVVCRAVDHDVNVFGRRALTIAIGDVNRDRRRRRAGPGSYGRVEQPGRTLDGARGQREREQQHEDRDDRAEDGPGASRSRITADRRQEIRPPLRA
jgi:hypothetical protein